MECRCMCSRFKRELVLGGRNYMGRGDRPFLAWGWGRVGFWWFSVVIIEQWSGRSHLFNLMSSWEWTPGYERAAAMSATVITSAAGSGVVTHHVTGHHHPLNWVWPHFLSLIETHQTWYIVIIRIRNPELFNLNHSFITILFTELITTV